MNAAICKQTRTVIWMLSNGSSISENTIKTTSCEKMMNTKGIYQTLSYLFDSIKWSHYHSDMFEMDDMNLD